jgi:hypothetical protein
LKQQEKYLDYYYRFFDYYVFENRINTGVQSMFPGSSPAAGINILEKNRLQVGSFFTRVARKIWEKRRRQARFGELLFCSDLASTAITRETR